MASPYKQVELTPEQANQWDTTITVFSHVMPGFRYILLKMLNHQQHGGKYLAQFTEDDFGSLAATDGFCVVIKPSEYFKLKLKERLFILAHEIAHCVLDDVNTSNFWSKKGSITYSNGKTLRYDDLYSNIAQDYRINDFLKQSDVGRMPDGKWKGLHDHNIATANDSWLDVYARIFKDKKGNDKGSGGQEDQQGGSGGQGNPQQPGQGFDKVLAPGSAVGKDPSTAAAERDEGQWQTAVAQAKELEKQKHKGKLPGGMARLFDEVLAPKISWQDLIRGELAMRAGPGAVDWFRPDPRLIDRDMFYPSSSGFGTEWVVLWADTSGSIGQTEMAGYLAEVGAIIDDVKPRRLTVIWCDACIHQVDDHITATDLEVIRSEGRKGGGGTDCRPVFKWIEENGSQAPDMFIGLTDLCALFPSSAPVYPVTWGATAERAAPFGEIVRIK